MSLPTDELRALFARLCDLPADVVYFDGEAEKHLGPRGKANRGKLVLNVAARAAVGTDDFSQQFEAPATLRRRHDVYRVITITARLTIIQGPDEAIDVLERVRMGLRRPRALAELSAVDMALVDSPSIVNLDGYTNDRAISVAALDVRFAQAVSEDVTEEFQADPESEGTDTWIETAETLTREG